MKATKKQLQEALAARRAARNTAWGNTPRFVQRAAVPEYPEKELRHIPNWRQLQRVYIAFPASPNSTWMTPDGVADTPAYQQPHCYMVATDSIRLHAALMPMEAAWIVATEYEEGPDLGHIIAKAAAEHKDGKRIVTNVQPALLMDAIHPDAANVQLVVGAEGGPLELFSFLEDGTQIGYAMIMPNVMPLVGQRPELPARERKTEKGD